MYERPLRSDELMHFGTKGMHWGVRKDERKLKKLWRAQASDIAKVSRIKARMAKNLSKRKTASKLLSASKRSKFSNQIFKGKLQEGLANTIDPMNLIRQTHVNHINKRMKQRLSDIANNSIDVSNYYKDLGEQYWLMSIKKRGIKSV